MLEASNQDVHERFSLPMRGGEFERAEIIGGGAAIGNTDVRGTTRQRLDKPAIAGNP
ncbi:MULTISPECIES: hypothetical protein [unclassified Achromobacter]|uniref:hypothetical protein n=1 Tax=unclassified Achromobacter TaxID=2626865 RepID=UPI001EF2DC61|nr:MULTISPECIES: hypothetical protein [unclassified Achromobacter]MCG7326868.1 hypothetical protein [Achromobacter sp. ACRQX]